MIPFFKLVGQSDSLPKPANGLGQFRSADGVTSAGASGEQLRFQLFKRGDGLLAALLQRLRKGMRAAFGNQGPPPLASFDAELQSDVFQMASLFDAAAHQLRFESGKPVRVSPVKSKQTQGALRQNHRRVMPDGVSLVDKVRNLVAAEDLLNLGCVAFQTADDNGDLTKADSLFPDSAENGASSVNDFRFGIGASRYRNIRLRNRQRLRGHPTGFEVLQWPAV